MIGKPDRKFFWIAGLCILAVILAALSKETYFVFMFSVFALVSLVAAYIPVLDDWKYKKFVVNGSTYFVGVTGEKAKLRSWQLLPENNVAVRLVMTNAYESNMIVNLLPGSGYLLIDWPEAKGIIFNHKLEVAKMIPDEQGRLKLLPQRRYLINPNGNEVTVLNYIG